MNTGPIGIEGPIGIAELRGEKLCVTISDIPDQKDGIPCPEKGLGIASTGGDWLLVLELLLAGGVGLTSFSEVIINNLFAVNF